MRPLLLACLLALPWAAHAKPDLSKTEFYNALIGAMTDRRTADQTTRGEQLAAEELAGVTAQGAWRLQIANACQMLGTNNSTSNEYGKMMSFRLPGVFGNTGTEFVFALNSQVVKAHQVARVEKALVDRLKTLNKEFGDLQGEINRLEDGSYQLTAKHVYGASGSEGRVRDRIAAVISNARFMICDIHEAAIWADHEQWKSLKGSEFGTLDADQFMALYPLFKEKGFAAKGDAPHGTWSLSTSKAFKMWIENHGDKMKLWVWVNVEPMPSAEKSAAILEKLNAIEPFGGAASIEAGISGNQFWVAAVHPYAGKSGKQITKALERFIEDDSDGFFKRVKKTVEAGL